MEKIKYKGQVYIRVDAKDNVVMLDDLAKLYSQSAEKIEKSYNKAKNAMVPAAVRDELPKIARELKAVARQVAELRAKRAREE